MFHAPPPRQECPMKGMQRIYIHIWAGRSRALIARPPPLPGHLGGLSNGSLGARNHMFTGRTLVCFFSCVFHYAITRPTVSHPLYYANKFNSTLLFLGDLTLILTSQSISDTCILLIWRSKTSFKSKRNSQ